MFSTKLSSSPSRHFMILTGIVCAAINSGGFLALAFFHQLHSPTLSFWIPIILAISSFLIYVRFTLLISARNTWWMLGRGNTQWLKLLFLILLTLLFLPDRLEYEAARVLIMQWAAIVVPLTTIALYSLRKTAHRLNNTTSSRRSAVFLNMGPRAKILAQRLQRSPILGIHVAGYYATAPLEQEPNTPLLPRYLGDYSTALPNINTGKHDVAFITLKEEARNPALTALLNQIYDSTTAIYVIPESTLLDDEVSSAEIVGMPLLAVHTEHMSRGLSRSLKRIMDLTFGGLLLLLATPIMLAITALIKLDSPGPVIFRQLRYGERGRPITVFKFRSMYVNKNPESGDSLRQAQVNDPRITRIGRILRKTSLDELPQLLNVLEGAMSLVGPRPHAAEHNELYRRLIHGYMLRHSVKPGITGWAQIHGLRGETDTPEKMRQRVHYDRYYIANWSLRLDFKILMRTIIIIFWDKNAY